MFLLVHMTSNLKQAITFEEIVVKLKDQTLNIGRILLPFRF